MKKAERGFTLIELLVVIAIIGILSSVVLASLNSARERSRDARRLADLQQIKLAAELYFDTNNAYPADIYDADNGLAPDFIGSVPFDPIGTNVEYAYEAAGSPSLTSYCLGAVLEGADNAPQSNEACIASLADVDEDINYAVAP